MLTVDEIISATKGKLLQKSTHNKCRNIVIDSRKTGKNDAYIAIIGHRLDGHKFIKSAVEAGAGIVIVSKIVKVNEAVTVIQVKDTTKALGLIAAYYRTKFNIPVIAVTGSVGKTSTKELIAKVLSSQLKVLKSEKTFNNHIGVPLTLFRLKRQHQAAVLELGTNQPGDISWLGSIVKPTLIVFTNIGESHLEKLKSKAGVFREKTSLIKYIQPEGRVIFNQDDKLLQKIIKKYQKKIMLGYGITSNANIKAEHIVQEKGIKFEVGQEKYEIKGISIFQVYNALAAITCGKALGIKYNSIKKALNSNINITSRMQIRKVGNLQIIDDSYNANPVSFKAAVDTLSLFKPAKRKFLICADMLELGSKAKSLHENCGRYAAKFSIDFILGVGKYTKYLILQANGRNNSCVAKHFVSRVKLHEFVKQNINKGDIILVKGSRSMQMEQTVSYITSLAG